LFGLLGLASGFEEAEPWRTFEAAGLFSSAPTDGRLINRGKLLID
jgi:hypothetical protein